MYRKFGQRSVLVLIGLVAVLLILFSWAQSRAQGSTIRYGETLAGTLSPGATDDWLFNGRSGDILAISVERTSDTIEPILILEDGQDQPLAGTQAGDNQDTAILTPVRLPASGSYIIRVSGNRRTSGSYQVALRLITPGPENQTPTPTAVRLEIAGTLTGGQSRQGQIGGPVPQQLWRFAGTAGSVVDIQANVTTGDLDVAMTLLAPEGETLINADASDSKNAAILAFQLPFNGEYTVAIRRSLEAGRSPTAAGRYVLSLILRNAPDSGLNTRFQLDSVVKGRLTNFVPRALYRLDTGGSLAIRLDMGGVDRMARVRILTLDGEALEDVLGLSPFGAAVRIPDRGPFLLEISSPVTDSRPGVDYALGVYRLGAAVNVTRARPLNYRQAEIGLGPETWFFLAAPGDMIQLRFTPDPTRGPIPTDPGQIRLIAPDDSLVFQADLGVAIEQPLILSQGGMYELDARTEQAYRIGIERRGTSGVAFSQFSATTATDALFSGTPLQSTLLPGSIAARWLDINDAKTISLNLEVLSGENGIGLALFAPDGRLVGAEVSDNVPSAVLRRVYVEEGGRYRLVIFDTRLPQEPPSPITYRVSLIDSDGSRIPSGTQIKSNLTPDDGLAAWTLEASAGSLINAALTNLTPPAWDPIIYLVAPGGRVIAQSTATGADVNLIGAQAPVDGLYRLVVAGRVITAFSSYTMRIDTQMPFNALDSTTPIRVSADRDPLPRYEVQPVGSPVRIPVAGLIAPLISPAQLPATEIKTLAFSTTVRGDIARGAAAQAWRLISAPNVVIQLRATSILESESVEIGAPFLETGETGSRAPGLSLWDRTGRVVAEQYRSEGGTTILTYRTTQGGTYDVVVSLGLNGGRYLLTLESVSVEENALTVSNGVPMAYGQTLGGELISADDVDTFHFIGATNDLVNLRFTRQTGNFVPSLQLIAPNNRVVVEDLNPTASTQINLLNTRLPDNGLYTIRLQNTELGGRAFGRYSLTLELANSGLLRSRGSGLINPGMTVRGALSLNNIEDSYLFQGKQGQRVSFVLAGEGALTPLSLRLQDSAGKSFVIQDSPLASGVQRVTDVMLSSDGVYRVQVLGGTQTAGTYSLTWENQSALAATGLLRYRQTVNGLFTADRAFENWTFSGTAGDFVSISLRYVRGQKFRSAFQLRAENGLVLARAVDVDDGQGARAEVLLPFSGSYTLTAANADSALDSPGVYALSVNLQDSKARSVGGPLRFGDQAVGDLYPHDLEDTWLFEARSGDVITIAVNAQDRFLKPIIELRSLTGESLASAGSPDSERAEIGVAEGQGFSIPGDGVYVIAVRGAVISNAATTGSYRLALVRSPVNSGGAEAIAYGDSRPGLIADDRPAEVYLFEGQGDDLVTASMSREPGADLAVTIEIRAEDGRLLARDDSNDGDTATIRELRLPQSGRYRLIATRYLGEGGETSGRYDIKLNGVRPERPIRAGVAYGQTALGQLGPSAPIDRLSFEARAGDVIGVTVRALSGDLDATLTLIGPSGESLAFSDDADGLNPALNGVALKTDGTYVLVVNRAVALSQGNYELLVTRLYRLRADTPAPQRLIPYGTRIVSAVDVENPESRYSFRGGQGDTISAQLLHQADDAPPQLSILDPEGETLAQGQYKAGKTTIASFTLPVSGYYTLVIRRPANARQNFSPFALTLDLIGAERQPASAGGVISAESAVTGTFSAREAAHYWLFPAKAGVKLSIGLLRLSGNIQPSALLIAPGGSAIGNLRLPAQTTAATTMGITLPVDGLYSLLVLPGSSDQSGRYRLALQTDVAQLPDVVSLLPGAPVTGKVQIGIPATRYAIEAQAGQTISVRAVATGGDLSPLLHLTSGDGVILAEGSQDRAARGPSSMIHAFPVVASGTYLVTVEAQSRSEGSYALIAALDSPAGTVSAEAAIAKPLTYGQPVRDVVQADSYTYWQFTGQAGDTVTIAAIQNDTRGEPQRGTPTGPEKTQVAQLLASESLNTAAVAIELRDLGGQILARGSSFPAAKEPVRESSISAYTLPTSGRYVIGVYGRATTSFTLIVQRRQDSLPEPVKSQLVAGDPIIFPDGAANVRRLVKDTPLENAITRTDPVDYWVLNGEAGSLISLVGSRLDGDLRLDLALYGPQGFIDARTVGIGESQIGLGPLRLPASGNYLLVATRWLGSYGWTAGRYRIVMSLPAEAGSAGGGIIAAYGQTVADTLAAGQDADQWTFSGQAGDVVEIAAVRLNGDLRPALELIAPEGSDPVLRVEANATDTTARGRAALPMAGTYTIRVARVGATSGGYSLTVNRIMGGLQASVGSAGGIAYGEQRTGEITTEAGGSLRAWVFYGRAGERAVIEVAPSPESALDPFAYLLGPDSHILRTDDNSGGGLTARIETGPLPGDGFYAIVVGASPIQREIGRTGEFTVDLQLLPPGASYQGKVEIGDQVVGAISPARSVQVWTFEVHPEQVGQVIAASLESTDASFTGILRITRTDGETLVQSSSGSAPKVETPIRSAGRFAVLVSGSAANASGGYRLRLGYALAPTGGGVLVRGLRGFGQIDQTDFSDAWRFELHESGPAVLSAIRLSGDLEVTLSLFGADGSLIAEQSAEGSNAARIEMPSLPAGEYLVIVSRVRGPAGQSVGNYTVLFEVS